MKWLKFEPQEEELSDPETSSILVYLGPEALKHAVIVDDFSSFQDSPECIPGGRLLEVSRQYSYRLRQIADLVEEPLDQKAEVEPEQATPSKEKFQEIESGEESIDQDFVDTSELGSRRTDRNVDSISKNRKVLKIS